MTINQNQKTLLLYILGIVFSLSILILGGYMIWRTVTTERGDDIIPIITQDILENRTELPQICQDVLSLLDCMMGNDILSSEHPSLSQYYQQLLSQRNIVSTLDILTQECTSQYRYITTLQYTGYTQAIASCV